MPCFKPRLSLTVKMHCFKQLAALLHAAVPLPRALHLLETTTPYPVLIPIYRALQMELQRGSRFSDCAYQHPLLFDAMSCQCIALGEASGQLDHAFTTLSQITETTYHQRLALIRTLAYPCFIFITGSLLLLSLLLFVVPRFEALFADNQHPLPILTRALFYLANHTFAGLLGLVLIVVILTIRAHQAGRHRLIKLPYLKQLQQDWQCHRCLQALSQCLHAGLPLAAGLQLASGFTSLPVLQAAIHDLRKQLYNGTPLAAAMQTHACFPAWVTALIKTGEESGTLDQLLQQACKHFDTLITERVNACIHSLQPLILLTQGVLIGGVVVGLYLPIFNLGTLI
jgi:type II secretory pathway component PulF